MTASNVICGRFFCRSSSRADGFASKQRVSRLASVSRSRCLQDVPSSTLPFTSTSLVTQQSCRANLDKLTCQTQLALRLLHTVIITNFHFCISFSRFVSSTMQDDSSKLSPQKNLLASILISPCFSFVPLISFFMPVHLS